MKNLFKLFYLLLCIPTVCLGNNEETYPYSKEKTITKTYIVNPNATTQIINSYGNINIYLWDENKISITATIKISGNKESTVIEKLEATNIDFNPTVSLVTAKTIFESSGWIRGKSNTAYEINYIVKIPKNGGVILENNYGNINIEKLLGTSKISCNYGNLNLGELQNKLNNIEISYSKKSSINYIAKLILDSQYSNLTILKGETVKVDGNYNDFTFQNIESATFLSNYNDITTHNIENINCDGNYLKLKLYDFDTANLDLNYCDAIIYPTITSKKIIIDSNYSTIKINCPETFAFDFDLNFGYGGLKTDLNLKYSEKSKKSQSKQYQGYYKNTGKAKIVVSSNYGSLQLINKQ